MGTSMVVIHISLVQYAFFFYLDWVELTQGLQLSQNDSHCDQKFKSRYFQITYYQLHSCFKRCFIKSCFVLLQYNLTISDFPSMAIL